MDRVILHVDLNNFYASVECLYNPELRNKPIAVSGDIEKRHGIVLAKNYLAKACGIKTGQTAWEAQQLCPNIIFVPARFDKYMKFSNLARAIYANYTDKVEGFGPDECWLDVSASKSFGSGREIADTIRDRIKSELGITASVGVSFNKIFAKLGSDMKKPDATTVITKENFKDIVWPLPVSDLLYVGRATNKKLNAVGIQTIGDLAKTDAKRLKNLLGVNGQTLWVFANGLDIAKISHKDEQPMIKSIGNSTTTPRDLITDDDVKITLYVLCESIAARLRQHGYKCVTIQLSIRENDLFCYQRQGALSYPACASKDLFAKAFELYKKNYNASMQKPIRSIGVRACGLIKDNIGQTSFLPHIAATQKQEKLEKTIDDIRMRFGHGEIRRAVMMTDTKLSAINPKEEHIIHPESYYKRGVS
jgi:DNA polymerase-4